MSRACASVWLVLGGLVLAGAVEAGQSVSSVLPPARTATALAPDLPFAVDGPPPPVPPEVITRDALCAPDRSASGLTAASMKPSMRRSRRSQI